MQFARVSSDCWYLVYLVESLTQLPSVSLMKRLSAILVGILSVFLFWFAGCSDRVSLARPNILIVSFDTTRADRLGCYGNTMIATPNLDRLANEGVLFEMAMSPIPITAPSHSSIMTGKVPFAHGVRDNGMFVLDDVHVTLAERLQALGYSTAASIGAFPLMRRFGLDQGFDLYDDQIEPQGPETHDDFIRRNLYFNERKAAQVNEPLLRWLEDRDDAPFFLWAH